MDGTHDRPLFVFYLLAAVAVASAVMVVSARNPVHSVLFLILAFFNSAGLFILIGAEFLAMILVVVYVGAVAVLFMFVVMMLESARFRAGGNDRFLRLGFWWLILLAELVLVGGTYGGGGAEEPAATATCAVSNSRRSATCSTPSLLPFQAAGHDPAGRDHRCHHPDPAAPAGAAAGYRAARSAACARRRSSCARCAPGAACDGDPGLALPDAGRHPVHDRRGRDLREPQERHHHLDVDRADPARGQHQLRRLLGLAGRPDRPDLRHVHPDRRGRRGRRSGWRSLWSTSAIAAASRSTTST